MRKTLNCDNTKNPYITKLEKIYNVNPLIFYSILNLFTGMQYSPLWPSFSHKTEFVHLPDREKIHTAHILQPSFELYVIDDQSVLSNPDELKRYITLIIQEKNHPHILIITPHKSHDSIEAQIRQCVPTKTDEDAYTIAVFTKAEFNKMYEHMKNIAISETAIQLHRLM